MPRSGIGLNELLDATLPPFLLPGNDTQLTKALTPERARRCPRAFQRSDCACAPEPARRPHLNWELLMPTGQRGAREDVSEGTTATLQATRVAGGDGLAGLKAADERVADGAAVRVAVCGAARTMAA